MEQYFHAILIPEDTGAGQCCLPICPAAQRMALDLRRDDGGTEADASDASVRGRSTRLPESLT